MAASLYDMAQRACIKNVMDLYDVGELRYEVLRPILKKVENPAQLVSHLPRSTPLPTCTNTRTASNRRGFTSYRRRFRRALAAFYQTGHLEWRQETRNKSTQESLFMVEGIPQTQARRRSRNPSRRRKAQSSSQQAQSRQRCKGHQHRPRGHTFWRKAIRLEFSTTRASVWRTSSEERKDGPGSNHHHQATNRQETSRPYRRSIYSHTSTPTAEGKSRAGSGSHAPSVYKQTWTDKTSAFCATRADLQTRLCSETSNIC